MKRVKRGTTFDLKQQNQVRTQNSHYRREVSVMVTRYQKVSCSWSWVLKRGTVFLENTWQGGVELLAFSI